MNSSEKNLFNLTKNFTYKEIMSNPILDIAARFWEPERYKAFKILYRSFRIVDDIVDNNKSINNKLSSDKIEELLLSIEQWKILIHNKKKGNYYQQQLFEVINKYHIPLWPWENFSKSMIYDLYHDGFDTIQTFFQYAEGASVAPASIFIHLCGVRKENNQFVIPPYDIRNIARPAAIFSYVVHIIRDFQRDQNNNLNYFADDLIHENGLNRTILKDIASGGKIPSGFRNLIRTYYEYGEKYRNKTRETIDKISNYLAPQYLLSLEILYNLYLQIFERIDIDYGSFTTEELNPSPSEIKERINCTISKFRYSSHK